MNNDINNDTLPSIDGIANYTDIDRYLMLETGPVSHISDRETISNINIKSDVDIKHIDIEGTGKIWLSDRRIPLIYIGNPDDKVPILTAELWSKWHTLYLLHPNGEVTSIDPNLEDDSIRYVDNVWNPHDIVRWCKDNNIILDELFYEMLVGRWETEIIEDKY